MYQCGRTYQGSRSFCSLTPREGKPEERPCTDGEILLLCCGGKNSASWSAPRSSSGSGTPICIGNHPITRMIMTTVRIDRGLADVFVNSFCRRSDIPLTSTRTWYLTCNYKWWEKRLFYTNSHGETANLCPRNDLATQRKDSVA